MAFLAKGIYGQPHRLVAQGEYEKVYKLKKSLYGLKQSPRAWMVCISQEFGLSHSKKITWFSFVGFSEREYLWWYM